MLYPTVYFLDGANYADWMQVPSVLDQLIAAKSIPPIIAVFIEPGSRQEEYSRNPAWRTFVARELVPATDKRFRTFAAPDHRVIFGSSLGAYGAVDLAVENPDVFGLCAAIAPPAQASTLLTNQSQGTRAIQGVRFFVLGAVYDTDVKGARTLRARAGGRERGRPLRRGARGTRRRDLPGPHRRRAETADSGGGTVTAVNCRCRAESPPAPTRLRARPSGTGTLK